jgi:folate-binding protein YgfZ
MEPRPGSEISSERFPVEIGLGRVLDHTKGCYVGQETIVRMRDRGTVKKRLTLLRLSGDALPSRGDKIETVEQAAAGFVTSAARMQGEAPVALAILSTALPVGAQVQVRHGEAVLSAEVVREAPPWG